MIAIFRLLQIRLGVSTPEESVITREDSRGDFMRVQGPVLSLGGCEKLYLTLSPLRTEPNG